jgi:alkyl hydroperoxide reductase subunit AhpF
VIVQNRATGELRDWQYDGVFVFIGLSPNSDLVKDKVETDRFGFLILREMGFIDRLLQAKLCVGSQASLK